MKKIIIGCILGMSMAASVAASDIEAGKLKAAVCAVCHGGNDVGYAPLEGLDEQYMISSLKAYQNKERSGKLAAVMEKQVAMLKEDDIKDIAAYYFSKEE